MQAIIGWGLVLVAVAVTLLLATADQIGLAILALICCVLLLISAIILTRRNVQEHEKRRP